MSSPNSKIPSYRLHKQSGQAIVTLRDATGRRRDLLLGKYGTPESRAEYRRVLAEWDANGQRVAPGSTGMDLTVNEVLLAYVRHAEGYYRHPDGRPTSEVNNLKLALRPLKELYGHTSAASFDALALEAVRGRMVSDGRCRNRVNKDVARIKRMFRWSASRKLVPASVCQELETVEGLRAGRSAARETEPIRPVLDAVVEATLPHLPRQVAAMVSLQRLTGMRPGEMVVMRGIDLEMREKVWLYRPGSDRGPHGAHKNAYRGHHRVILIGPKGQEILRLWLRLNLQEYLFQPREAVAEFRAEQRKKRKTKVQPSQQDRSKRRPKKQPGEHYTVVSYAHAVYKACDAAFPPPASLSRQYNETKKEWQQRLTREQKAELHAWRKSHRWHPNRLRHAKATEIRREAGLDAARVVLGHSSPQITEVYAEIDVNKAAEVMERLG
jgi:site-specific recombinase XerD